MDPDQIKPEIRDEIKYKLLTLKHTKDDPVLQAQLLKQLLDIYKHHNIQPDQQFLQYARQKVREIENQLQRQIADKKKKLQELKQKKH